MEISVADVQSQLSKNLRLSISASDSILKGLKSFSPGLRVRASYPGKPAEKSSTLKGLHPGLVCSLSNPFRVGICFAISPQGSPAHQGEEMG